MKLQLHIPGPRWTNTLLRVASVLTLVALALMVWSVIEPTPMPVLLAMSLGQVLGTAAFGMYGLVVIADIRRQYVRRRDEAKESSQQVPVIADAASATPAAPTATREETPP